MPRLIAIARVRNEDDIIEAFVRHHAALVDRLILLDNASDDRTLEILASLKSEGLRLTVYQCESVTFVESAHNTFLFRQAASLGADWVLCLDADEFIDTRRLPTTLGAHLEGMPAEVSCLSVDMINYQPTGADDRSELNVTRRLVRRDAEPNGARKIFLRGDLASAGVVLAHGNHEAFQDGVEIRPAHERGVMLAHYPMRSGWQMLAKALVGRLKVLASGPAEVERQTAVHYTDFLSSLEHNPQWLLDDPHFLNGTRPPEATGAGVEDPIVYLGSALEYTEPADPRFHALRSLMRSTDALARRHGAIVTGIEGARVQTELLDRAIIQVI